MKWGRKETWADKIRTKGIEEVETEEDLIDLCRFRVWRLNNLYQVVDEDGVPRTFRMRWVQREIWKSMRRGRRKLILKARQMGCTTFIDIFGLDLIVWTRDLRGQILAHKEKDAKAIYRDKLLYGYAHLPKVIRRVIEPQKADSGELLLSNNSGIRVTTGSQSSTLQFLHVSEYGPLSAKYPEKAREIRFGSLPAAHEKAWVFLESTAQGRRGEWYEMCMQAQEVERELRAKGEAGLKEWEARLAENEFELLFFPWYRNPAYTKPELKIDIGRELKDYFGSLKAEHGIELSEGQKIWYAVKRDGVGGIGPENMLQQYPSTVEEAFKYSGRGAYYADQMMEAYREGRVGKLGVDAEVPVHTAWDIGRRDSTAIWFFQVWRDGTVAVLDYYENCGCGLPHYVNVLKARQREWGWRYGRFFAPFDVKQHNWSTDKTTAETALREHGILFEPVVNVSLQDGIQAARNLMRRCRFDSEHCGEGLEALEAYSHEWNAEDKCFRDTPRHDWSSHGADAFRYLALSDVVDVETKRQHDIAELEVDKWFRLGADTKSGMRQSSDLTASAAL